MKNALLKDTTREIWRTFSRFLSIFSIVALGVAFFAGIKASAIDMKITGDKYFDEYRLMDIRLVSTLGFDDKDIAAITKTKGIEDIQPAYSMDSIATVRDKEIVVKLLSLPSSKLGEPYINMTKLIDGRYPENLNECLIEEAKMMDVSTALGTKIRLSSGTDKDILEKLKNSEYTIVGIVETPYYISYDRGTSSVGSGKINSFVMLPEENFKLPVYTDIFLTVKNAREAFTYSEAYKELIKSTSNDLKLEKPTWYVLDRNANPGYIDYEFSADRVAAIARVFPVFFFLIAALVCLTTMTRMVDEQRVYIGTLKALGYSKMAIASKYLIYAALASVGGSVFGILIGFKLFPTVIFNAYSIMFTMPPVITAFNTYYAILSTVLAVTITIMATWVACSNELRTEPAILMLPKSPMAGKRITLERIKFIWSRLNFTQKITARNIFRYKKRFMMTVLGIGGCTALLLSGFGLKDSILSIAAIQFDELYKYDMVIQLKGDVAIGQKNSLIGTVAMDSRISDYMLVKEQSIDIGSDNKEKSAYLIVPESTKRLEEFISFRTREDHKAVPFTGSGVILSEKLSNQLQAKVGTEIYIKLDGNKKVKVKVEGITEHYISHYIYMSPELYQKVFGKQVEFKQVIAKTVDTTEEFESRLSSELLKNKDVSAIRFTTGISKDFRKIIKSLNYVILVLIFSAGALAFIVLYNLANVNVTERLRELATIKVLGFFDREVSAYVDRESVLLTLIGMLLGLVLGVFLHRYIIVTAEIDYVMFGRIVKPISYVYAGILTIFFSLLVNIVMHLKLKKISMVESLKSVD
ncbi:MAG: ABC transporter permease [Lutisporaceae bacterium]